MIDQAGDLLGNFRAAACLAPEAPAFTFLHADAPPSRYTFRQRFGRVDEISDALRGHELARDAPLGILLQSQEEQVLHYLAALAIGLTPAILTPPNRRLAPNSYAATLRSVAESCRFSAVVVDEERLEIGAPLLRAGSLEPIGSGGDRGQPTIQTSGAAFLEFSSGTTGLKRGVLITHRMALLQLIAYAEAIGLSREDRIVSWLPLYHDMGLIACLNLPLAFGVHCVMIQPLDWVADPASYLRAASEFRATLGWNPNFAYAFMARRVRPADLGVVDLSCVRGLVNCSEPTTFEAQRRFLEAFGPHGLRADVFRGCYAMAETTFAITDGAASDPGYLDPRGPDGMASGALTLPLISAGRPLPGVELRVVDDKGGPLGERSLGELCVHSPFNFAGHYHGRDATAGDPHAGWYRTGDLGYRVGDEVFVCGRTDDRIIVEGINIFPQDVEELVAQVAGVHPGRVAAFSTFDAGNQTGRLIVLAEADRPEAWRLDLIVAIRRRIVAAFQVSNFEVELVPPGWLIKSSSGKLARAAIHAKWTTSNPGPAAPGINR